MTGTGPRQILSDILSDEDAVKVLDEQKRRHARLQERQRIVQHELAQRLRDLETAREEARAAFGTDDPDTLKQMLAERRARNSETVLVFKESLDRIEQELARIERQAALR